MSGKALAAGVPLLPVPRCVSPRRRGLSLMEMMLVLAVMVAAAAVVWPALQGPMDDHRLRKAGDLVLAQWGKARVTAMKTGQMQIFRYELATDRYQIQPWQDSTDLLNAPADVPQQAQMQIDNSTLQRDSSLGVSGVKLPEGITFFLGETEMDSRMLQSESEMSMPDAGPQSPQPIVFYPDGSTSNARLVLTNERFFVELKLRGLTGLATASDLLSIEEVAQ